MKNKIRYFLLLLPFYMMLGQDNLQYVSDSYPDLKNLENWALENYDLHYHSHDFWSPNKDKIEHEALLVIQEQFRNALGSKRFEHDNAKSVLIELIEEHGHNRYVNSYANYFLGALFLQKRDYKSAIACFELVYPEDLDFAEFEGLYFNKAYANFIIKEFDAAIKSFQSVVQIRGALKEPAHYYLGYLSFINEDYKTAERAFQDIQNSKRYAKVVPYYLTQIYFVNEDFEKVTSYSTEMVKKPGVKYKKEMNYLIGQSYFKRNYYEEALPYLQEYVKQTNKVRKEDLYQLAYTEYQLGYYTEAIPHFIDLNTLEEEMGQNAMYLLADCYLKTSDFEKARIAFRNASKKNYDLQLTEASAFNAAKLSVKLEDDRAAIQDLKDFIDQYPNNNRANEAKNLLAQTLEATDNYEEALIIIESIHNPSRSLQESYQRMAYYRGVELYNDNNYARANTYFNYSLQYPLDSEITAATHFWQANLLQKQESEQSAIAKYKQYLQKPNQSGYGIARKSIADYNLGHIYLAQNDYSNAHKHFQNAVTDFERNMALTKMDGRIYQIYEDALVRLGDSYFMVKNLSKAEQYYSRYKQTFTKESDYVSFQLAMIQGAGSKPNYSRKLQRLNEMVNDFPTSLYKDDALFQLGQTYAKLKQPNKAQQAYSTLINEYPTSSFTAKANNELALQFFSLGRYEDALKHYKNVVGDFPNTIESSTALLGIRDTYLQMGNSDGYFKYIKKLPKNMVSTSAQDSTRFNFVESLYGKNDCTKTIEEATKYLNEFTSGSFRHFVLYYRADCNYKGKEFASAKQDFEILLAEKAPYFREETLDKLSRISFSIDRNYSLSYDFYSRLYELSSNPSRKFNALKGMVRSSYKASNWSAVRNTGLKALDESDKITKDETIEFNYYVAEAYFHTGSKAESKTRYTKVASQTKNENGAIARYRLAEMLFEEGKFDDAKKACLRIDKETPNQIDWVVKGFLIIAKVYEQKKDYFQAKATLISILDNYDGDEIIVSEAQGIMSRIEAKEKSESKLEESSNQEKLIELDENN